jgi:transcriptional regulator with XRE-family HTH domain
MTGMAANDRNSAATHFGRQMKKERLAHGWSLREFAARTGIDFTTVSRIENGRRPPTQKVAAACDRAFPGRHGWFGEYYEESRHRGEIPPGFRDWSELEEQAVSLCDWYPGIITGLLQTEDYARALLSTYPAVTGQAVSARLANRMERQRRVLLRGDPPAARFVVDEMALYRRVGSPAVMADQMRHLSAVAALPHVTIQVLPAVAHPANASGFIVAGDSAWCEHVKSGYVYTGETVTPLLTLFDTLRGECYRVSDSAALLERMAAVWTHGVRAVVQTPTAASAPK